METGKQDTSPSTKSQIREQELRRRSLVMYRLDEYAAKRGRSAKEPFGSSENAMRYFKTIVDDTDVGDYLYKKGVEIKLTNNISVKAGEAYDDYSSGLLQKGRNLIVIYKDKSQESGERHLVIGRDFKGGVEVLKQAGFNLKGLEKKTPMRMVGRIKGAIQFNAEPIASRVKQAGKIAAAGLAGAVVLAGGVYKGPEIVSEIQHDNKQDSEHVQATDQSIEERYGNIVPTPVAPAPTETEKPGASVNYSEFMNKLEDEGRKNGYYFVNLTVNEVDSGRGRKAILFPATIAKDSKLSTFLMLTDKGSRSVPVSNEDAQNIQALMRSTIKSGNDLKSSPETDRLQFGWYYYGNGLVDEDLTIIYPLKSGNQHPRNTYGIHHNNNPSHDVLLDVISRSKIDVGTR